MGIGLTLLPKITNNNSNGNNNNRRQHGNSGSTDISNDRQESLTNWGTNDLSTVIVQASRPERFWVVAQGG